jgi:hypothetical protein
VAVYIKDKENDIRSLIRAIQRNKYIKKYVDIHLLYRFENGEFYPVNSLRNFATKHARTPLVFHADADFIPNVGMNTLLRYTHNPQSFDT